MKYPNKDYTPPSASGIMFSDVSISTFAANWIEQLASDGITSGCDDGKYCPDAPVTRAQMAFFLLLAKYNDVPNYQPPPVGTDTGFNDVAPGDFAADWIKQLAIEGITSGCGGGNYCPTMPVTRAQMAVFLVKAFSLPESGPPVIPPDPIQNGGFESGPVAWEQFSWKEFDLIINTNNPNLTVSPHSGSWLAWLGGYPEEVSTITQEILIPAGRSYLHYWVWTGSEDLCGYDEFEIYVDSDAVHSEALCKDNNTSGWVHRTIDLSAYIGATIHLQFVTTQDDSIVSNVLLDDISLEP